MFRFAPPPAPETADSPCPQCGAREAIALYATAATRYYRCTQCRQIRAVPQPDEHDPHPVVAA